MRWPSTVALIVLALAGGSSASRAADDGPMIDSDVRAAARGGTVRVLVELRASRDDAAAIRNAQDEVERGLAGTAARVARRYATAPFIALEIDWDGNNTIDDELVFEPTYQNPVDGGLCGVGSNQGTPVLQTWQFWDALRNDGGMFMACWWSMNDPAFPPGDVIRPLSEYIAAHPNAAIVNLDGNHGGVQIIHGFSEKTDTYDGWVDAFTIGKDINGSNGQTQNSTITYDFEKP